METENEVKTDPEPTQQENGAPEKMEESQGNGNAENGDAPSHEQKPGTDSILKVESNFL